MGDDIFGTGSVAKTEEPKEQEEDTVEETAEVVEETAEVPKEQPKEEPKEEPKVEENEASATKAVEKKKSPPFGASGGGMAAALAAAAQKKAIQRRESNASSVGFGESDDSDSDIFGSKPSIPTPVVKQETEEADLNVAKKTIASAPT